MNPKMSNLGSKMDAFFAVLVSEIDLQKHLEPSRAPKLKIDVKRIEKVPIITTGCTYIVLKIEK